MSLFVELHHLGPHPDHAGLSRTPSCRLNHRRLVKRYRCSNCSPVLHVLKQPTSEFAKANSSRLSQLPIRVSQFAESVITLGGTVVDGQHVVPEACSHWFLDRHYDR